MPTTTLWREITRELTHELDSSRFRRDDAFYTIDDISKRYRVSQITSRRVLDELARMDLVQKIQGKGTFVKGRLLHRDVKFIIPSSHNLDSLQHHSFIYLLTMQGINRQLVRLHADLVPVSIDGVFNLREKELLLTSYQIFRDLLGERFQEFLKERGHLCVCWGATRPVPGIGTVGGDFKQGSLLAVDHLVAKGHRSIAFVTGAVKNEWFVDRFAGYFEGLVAHRLGLDLSLVVETSGLDEPADWRAMDRLLAVESPPTAVLAANYTRALHILSYCRSKGLHVPGDLAVVCFDNNNDTEVSEPPLTVVDIKPSAQGATAVDMLLDMAESAKPEPRHVALDPELVVRGSA